MGSAPGHGTKVPTCHAPTPPPKKKETGMKAHVVKERRLCHILLMRHESPDPAHTRV